MPKFQLSVIQIYGEGTEHLITSEWPFLGVGSDRGAVCDAWVFTELAHVRRVSERRVAASSRRSAAGRDYRSETNALVPPVPD
jgi:hypothetical protein